MFFRLGLNQDNALVFPVYFEWRTYSAGKAYPCIDGHYRRPNGKGTTFLTNFSYAILSNGIYGAAMKAIAVKNMCGYPCPDIHTLANELLRWLKETSKQHNFDMYDIPDITNEGKLMRANCRFKEKDFGYWQFDSANNLRAKRKR